MTRAKVKLDHAGIAEILRSAGMHAVVQEATQAVAENASGFSVRVEGEPGEIELPVESDVTTTDRAHGFVTLSHPSGEAAQAKDGVLTKAAAAAGLEVNAK